MSPDEGEHMAGKTLKQRIGIDLGRRLPLEDGIRWAAENDVCVIDAQTDIAPNALETFDDARCACLLYTSTLPTKSTV